MDNEKPNDLGELIERTMSEAIPADLTPEQMDRMNSRLPEDIINFMAEELIEVLNREVPTAIDKVMAEGFTRAEAVLYVQRRVLGIVDQSF